MEQRLRLGCVISSSRVTTSLSHEHLSGPHNTPRTSQTPPLVSPRGHGSLPVISCSLWPVQYDSCAWTSAECIWRHVCYFMERCNILWKSVPIAATLQESYPFTTRVLYTYSPVYLLLGPVYLLSGTHLMLSLCRLYSLAYCFVLLQSPRETTLCSNVYKLWRGRAIIIPLDLTWHDWRASEGSHVKPNINKRVNQYAASESTQ